MSPFSILKRALDDVAGRSCPRRTPARHLQSAIDWLCHAHAQSPDDGVSYGYSLRGGWRPSYIETSGYIATTFFRLAARFENADYRARAVRIADWLCRVQNPDGSFSNHRISGHQGIVFDTGQDLFGLIRAWRETGQDRYRAAAQSAADWLVAVADSDGLWTRNTFNAIPHVYNSRTAWALLQWYEASGDPACLRVARRNLDWALDNEQDGYFRNCAFEENQAPYTHNIAYAIRGILESADILKDDRYHATAERAARAVLAHVRDDGFIPGRIDADGQPAAGFCCLTGNAQLAIVWLKLYQRNGETAFLAAAERALEFVMSHQDITTMDRDIRGAISGSHPIWGNYSPFTYPNWPSKFFIDAMLLLQDVRDR